MSTADQSVEDLERQNDALRAENAEKQREIDALQGQSPERLQLEIDHLRKGRPNLVPPLVVLGVGVACLVASGILLGQKTSTGTNVTDDVFTGVPLFFVGSTVTVIGLVWLIVDAVRLSNVDRDIEALEAQQRNASSGVRVTPWARGDAGGLALSLPLR